ncbi:uncharacterized protein SOCE26_057940 [Sorangium cellulosum]|uniref:Uncharacterized protein n=1 Tax=Sorangium cellulosum TaxID=56 RepID=A0A2L0EYG8_SORCE|nr:hypothetical protein [Sorangium cellulosum]AUX44330.1 uncharacterized protein SOCE26_057940 [Sorangium cellulosum]
MVHTELGDYRLAFLVSGAWCLFSALLVLATGKRHQAAPPTPEGQAIG